MTAEARRRAPSLPRAADGSSAGELVARKAQLMSRVSASKSSPWLSSSSASHSNHDDSPTLADELSLGTGGILKAHSATDDDDTFSTISSSTNTNTNRSRKAHRGTGHESLSLISGSQQQHATAVEAKLVNLSEVVMSRGLEGSEHSGDLYIVLAKKEKDLQLAAELGKVLLEKNEELSRANELLAEDYSTRLEQLEEEKHKLKRKFNMLSGECDNKLAELQSDCEGYKQQLVEQQASFKKFQQDKCKLIDELMRQNERLTSELLEATKSEESLAKRLEALSSQMDARSSKRHEHASHLEVLNDELTAINQRKQDVERRLKRAETDKQSLSLMLEESGDKLVHLQAQLGDLSVKLATKTQQLDEYKHTNNWLMAQVESVVQLDERLAKRLGNFSSLISNQIDDNLSNELNTNELCSLANAKRTTLVEQLNELRCRAKQPANQASDHYYTCNNNNNKPEVTNELYKMLREFERDLQKRCDMFGCNLLFEDNNNGALGKHQPQTDDSGISAASSVNVDNNDDDFDDQTIVELGEWRTLLKSLSTLISEMPCNNCRLMLSERHEFEALKKKAAKVDVELRIKKDQALASSSRLLIVEAELEVAQQKCQLLEDDIKICDSQAKSDELLQRAWASRDEAVERKNRVQISLAKCRVELMQISSQLMEAVQQKAELSQKLAQFEDDILSITQDSVKAKFTWEKTAEQMRQSHYNAINNSRQNPQIISQLIAFATGSPTNSNNNATTNGSHTKTTTQNSNSIVDKLGLKFWQRTNYSPTNNKQQTNTLPSSQAAQPSKRNKTNNKQQTVIIPPNQPYDTHNHEPLTDKLPHQTTFNTNQSSNQNNNQTNSADYFQSIDLKADV